MALGRRSSWPFGIRVTRIVDSVIIPGTDRSRPRCWMTSVCPMPAIARMAANGSIESNALRLTLPLASSGLTANSTAVATQIAEKRGTRRRERMSARRSIVGVAPAVPDERLSAPARRPYWAIQPPSATRVAPSTYREVARA